VPARPARVDGGTGSEAGLPGDEFVIVLAGSIRLGPVVLEADGCAVIPSGVAFDWAASPGTRALAMRYATDTPAADRIVPIDESAELTPSNPPLADLLVRPTPSCRNHTDYRSSDGVFICAPGTPRPITVPRCAIAITS
jgi:hypothetical protein